jgi:hypothetical protein
MYQLFLIQPLYRIDKQVPARVPRLDYLPFFDALMCIHHVLIYTRNIFYCKSFFLFFLEPPMGGSRVELAICYFNRSRFGTGCGTNLSRCIMHLSSRAAGRFLLGCFTAGSFRPAQRTIFSP